MVAICMSLSCQKTIQVKDSYIATFGEISFVVDTLSFGERLSLVVNYDSAITSELHLDYVCVDNKVLEYRVDLPLTRGNDTDTLYFSVDDFSVNGFPVGQHNLSFYLTSGVYQKLYELPFLHMPPTFDFLQNAELCLLSSGSEYGTMELFRPDSNQFLEMSLGNRKTLFFLTTLSSKESKYLSTELFEFSIEGNSLLLQKDISADIYRYYFYNASTDPLEGYALKIVVEPLCLGESTMYIRFFDKVIEKRLRVINPKDNINR